MWTRFSYLHSSLWCSFTSICMVEDRRSTSYDHRERAECTCPSPSDLRQHTADKQLLWALGYKPARCLLRPRTLTLLMATRFLALVGARPSTRMKAWASATGTSAMDAASGARANSAGVTSLTLMSVLWVGLRGRGE